MELKIKFLNWTAGIPVVMLNKKTAEKAGIHTHDRISIRTLLKYPKEISTIVNLVENLVKENEIGVSSEIKKRMRLKKGQKVDINFAPFSESLGFIKKKLNGERFSKKELFKVMKNIVSNSLSEAEITLLISAMYEKGMNFKETVYLVKAILSSGDKLSLKNKFVVDKHCVGGVPGNRTTPIVVPICATTGLIMPKTSSRAITSAAGTADCLETIMKIDFKMQELKRIIQKTNACMVWGGALGMVPADSKIINLEKRLKIDPESQLLASIMSKKLAVGSKYILIDIPYGKTAKVNKKKALHLKNKFEELGKYFKKKLKVVLTDGSQPIGNGIGPGLELRDLIKVLDPKEKGPKDLEDKSLFLSGEILEMTGKAKKGKGIEMAKTILYSGKAFEKFKQIVKAQKGKLQEIKSAKFEKNILAKNNCTIKEINNKKINSLARIAGCPVDKFSGLYLYFHKLDKIKKSEKILTIYSKSKSRLSQAIRFYKTEKPIKFK